MKRRSLLKGALLAPTLALPAVTRANNELHPENNESYKDLYYRAQREIDELYEKLDDLDLSP